MPDLQRIRDIKQNCTVQFDRIFHVIFLLFPQVITTQGKKAIVYDIATGEKIRQFESRLSNDYTKNRATIDPTDDLILNDGVLFDMRQSREIKKLDKLNQNLNGVFHPNSLEIVSNTEVWDLRTFHLLKTVPGLDQCQVNFTL